MKDFHQSPPHRARALLDHPKPCHYIGSASVITSRQQSRTVNAELALNVADITHDSSDLDSIILRGSPPAGSEALLLRLRGIAAALSQIVAAATAVASTTGVSAYSYLTRELPMQPCLPSCPSSHNPPTPTQNLDIGASVLEKLPDYQRRRAQAEASSVYTTYS